MCTDPKLIFYFKVDGILEAKGEETPRKKLINPLNASSVLRETISIDGISLRATRPSAHEYCARMHLKAEMQYNSLRKQEDKRNLDRKEVAEWTRAVEPDGGDPYTGMGRGLQLKQKSMAAPSGKQQPTASAIEESIGAPQAKIAGPRGEQKATATPTDTRKTTATSITATFEPAGLTGQRLTAALSELTEAPASNPRLATTSSVPSKDHC
ncbi:MAG: hypothetical protein Q9203_001889 [Teloschistes exilis]